MKIANSMVAMSSQSRREVTAVSWQTRQVGRTGSFTLKGGLGQNTGMNFSFQGALKSRSAALNKTEKERQEDPIKTIRQSAIMYLLDVMSRKVTGPGKNHLERLKESLQSGDFAFQSVHIEEGSYYKEEQYTSFSSMGTVQTADGRTISFDMSVSMSSSFEQYYMGSYDTVEQIDLTDPLVINLENAPASIGKQTFYFDLDCDGEKEQMHMLSSGSGFLALDKNGDGQINDGSELFGPQSGNGFADLAQYDEDKNGWIDENDRIFDQLKIWIADEKGNMQLYSLKEKNVGAINLGYMPTAFNHYDAQGKLGGAVRSTGMFLFEDGAVGSMQHLDMAT